MARSSSKGVRIAALVGTAILGAAGLSACSGDGGGSEGGDQTITILSSWATGQATGDQLNKNIEAFTEKTGIKVEVEEVNNDDVDKAYEASALAGEQADIVVLNLTPSSADWLPDGLVVDTEQYMNDWGIADKLQQGAIDYWTNENGVNGFPFIGFNWPIWYNMDLLAQAGVDAVPATFDEFLDTSAKLRDAGIQPFALGGKDWTAQNFITWMGQQYVAPEKMATVFAEGGWCSEDVVKGLDLISTMRDENVFIDDVAGYDGDTMTNAYFTGVAAMMPAGSWTYTNEAGAEVAAHTELAGFPVPEGGHYTNPSGYNGHSAGFFLSPNAEDNIDAVQQFMEFMYSDEVLKGWVSDASQILDAKPEVVAGAESEAPLVVAGGALGEDNTSWLLLPDEYLPAGTDWGPTIASEFLGQTGTTGADLCKSLDAEYAN